MKNKKIILQIQSRLSFDAQISILGGMFDPAGNTVNTHNLYTWDVTGQSYSGLSICSLLYRKVGVVPYTTLNMAVPISFKNLIEILNQQRLGVFWHSDFLGASDIIYISSDEYQFNQLSIA